MTSIDQVSIKGEQRKPDAGEQFLYVDIGSIDREKKIVSTAHELFGSDAPSRARKMIRAGDVLVSLTRPNLNAVALVGKEYDEQIASTGFEVIRPVGMDSRFLYYLVRSKAFVDAISGRVQGALYPAAKSHDVKNYQFSLPPAQEQRSIANKLDEMLAQVNNLKARLDAIPAILKRLRQSVLEAAVSGRLTSDWRKESRLNPAIEVELDCVIDKGPQNGIYKPSSAYGEGVRIIRIDGFYDGELIPWSGMRRLEISCEELGKWRVNAGDILINRVNSIEYLGKCALVRDVPEEAVFESNIMRFSVDSEKAIPGYVMRCLGSSSLKRQLVGKAKHAVNQASINQKDVKSCVIPLPQVEEQAEIVRRVDQLFAFADQVEKQVENAQARVNKLTQSILAKAFRGELTADWRAENPELISGAHSAEALLARIKAEKEKLKPAKSRRGSKTKQASMPV
ncbi:restriction endonuclease subunit S [Halomonas getboli]|uniref:restriction endonuclease subunit S n=1 Tax=Halomonas getboli TaxID=2935862 RepID=UPI001FFE9808|nr:restriction endonuclease subunit S [Halomonas getboli]MCK2183822.1 restriction endonuclease subunit S [Halomonas getboli]